MIDIASLPQKLNAISKTAFVHQGLYGGPGFAGTDKQQDSIVAALCDLSKNVNQKRMVLLGSKAPHMSNGKLVADEAQVGSRLRTSLRIEAKAIQIDCVVYDLEVRSFTEKPFTGKLTTCKSVCWIPIRLRFQHGLQGIFGILPLTARRVTMGDPHRNTRLLRSTKRKDRKRVDVTVDNLPALLLKETLKLSLVFSYMLIGRYLKDPATERFDLVTGNKRRIGINKKIKLHFTAIDVTIVIHNDSFDAAANHLANNLSHPNRFSHLASTSTGKDLNDREENNLQVRDGAALGDVLQITADHPVEVGVVALGNLPPAGDARLHC